MTLFVTGATGLVGSELVRALVDADMPFVAGLRDPSRARPVSLPGRPDLLDEAAEGTERRRFDFRDATTWDDALKGCTTLFLLRPPAIADVDETLNAFATRAVHEHDVRHIIFVSVMGADKMRFIPHNKVEHHLEALDCATTMLRPGFFAQNFQSAYLDDILHERRVLLPAKDARVAFLDLADMADATVHILRDLSSHEGKAYTLTGPKRYTFEEATQLLGEAIEQPVTYEAISAPRYAWRLKKEGMSFGQAAVQTILHVDLRRGTAAEVDPTLATLLDHPPRALDDYFARNAVLWEEGSKRRSSS